MTAISTLEAPATALQFSPNAYRYGARDDELQRSEYGVLAAGGANGMVHIYDRSGKNSVFFFFVYVFPWLDFEKGEERQEWREIGSVIASRTHFLLLAVVAVALDSTWLKS